MKREILPNPGGRRVLLTLSIFLGWGLHGCATPSDGVRPQTGALVVTRVQGAGGGDVYLTSELSKGTFHFNAPPEQVWIVAPSLFEELGIEINYKIPSARAIGNTNFRVRRIGGARNSRYLDCGYGRTAVPNADGYEVTGSLISTFRSGEDGTTIMETLFTASARAREVSGGNVGCTSKGALERAMAEILTEMLAGAAGEK